MGVRYLDQLLIGIRPTMLGMTLVVRLHTLAKNLTGEQAFGDILRVVFRATVTAALHVRN
jgi:hypothetical protein